MPNDAPASISLQVRNQSRMPDDSASSCGWAGRKEERSNVTTHYVVAHAGTLEVGRNLERRPLARWRARPCQPPGAIQVGMRRSDDGLAAEMDRRRRAVEVLSFARATVSASESPASPMPSNIHPLNEDPNELTHSPNRHLHRRRCTERRCSACTRRGSLRSGGRGMVQHVLLLSIDGMHRWTSRTALPPARARTWLRSPPRE